MLSALNSFQQSNYFWTQSEALELSSRIQGDISLILEAKQLL